MHLDAVELLTALQEVQFNQKARPDDVGAAVLEQLAGRGGGTAGRQDVVDQEDLLAMVNGVVVDLEGVGAVFEDVFVALLRPGELARLADGNEACAEALGDATAEDEAARFDGCHGRDALAQERLGQRAEGVVERFGVAEERRDVAKEDAGFWEVGNVADVVAQVHQNFTSKSPSRPLKSFVSWSIRVTSAYRGPSFSSSSHSSMAVFSPSTS